MSVELPQTQRPVLNEQARSFVRRALSAGLVEIDDVKKVVMSMMSQSVNDEHAFVAERLAECLVHAGVLTQWQASKLLAGCGKGFYLGSYRLLRPLGKGGMGVVYLGEHHVMKRLVALKILPPEATNDARRISRFKEESVACGKLDHPNIVRAYDCDAVSGKLFIAIEYVDGIDLQRSVQRDGVMSIADALDMLRQATDGLAHAHERGIIHRDIKPANLILRSDGVLKVSDLGLARDGWSSTDGECRMMGTVDFIAPEQAINSQDAGTWSDIYSLGCTIYYLLTGRTPYDGTPRQRLAKHQAGAIPDVRETRSDCPAAIAELLMRMMAKKP
ncbi:MAG: serine/threonine-protein kinase, partial [Planctomycetota bacterium]